MDTRKISTEYRLAKWSQLLQERKETGETVAEFSKRIGVSKNTVCYWQRKLRAAACNELAEMPQSWALAVQSPQPEQNQIIVEVNDCRITVTPNTDAEFLAKICRTLKAL